MVAYQLNMLEALGFIPARKEGRERGKEEERREEIKK